MRNILITNDDGIEAEGIIRLAETAKRYGDVWIVAPDGQRSAASHKITLRETIDVYRTDFPVAGVKAFKTTGTPADCVRFGVTNIVKGSVDAVLSGINFGYNIGSDVQYSATIGAAMEAAHLGLHAVALSEGWNGCHEVTDEYLSGMLDEVIEDKLSHNQMWNINFPMCPLKECKGVLYDRTVAHNSFWDDYYLEEELPDGGIRLTVQGNTNLEAVAGTDFKALLDGYVSVSKIKNITHIDG